MTDPLRVAILGTGSISRAHMKALAALNDSADPGAPGLQVVGAADIVPDRVATFSVEQGVEAAFAGLEDMLAAVRPDVVHICTPPGGHAGQAVTALRAGVHVICEKPPVLTLAEFDEVAAAERASGRYYTTIFQHRFGSAGKHIDTLMSTGAFGQPRVALCNTMWYRDDVYYEVPWRGNWANEGGGPTLGHGVHQIDLLAHLLGDWTEVTATAVRLARDVETEDVAMAHVAFANGALASIVTSVLSPRQESYLRFDFDDATVELSHLYGYSGGSWTITGAPHVDEQTVAGWAPPTPDVPSGHAAELRDVYAALAAGRRPPSDSDSARRTVGIYTAIYASAFGNRTVRQDELVPGHPYYDSLTGGATPPVPSSAGPTHRVG